MTEQTPLELLITETKGRLQVLSNLSDDLISKLDDKELNEHQKLHACQFSFAITDAISVIINFNNKLPTLAGGADVAGDVANDPSASA